MVSGRRSEREAFVLWHGVRIRTLESVRHEGRAPRFAFCPYVAHASRHAKERREPVGNGVTHDSRLRDSE